MESTEITELVGSFGPWQKKVFFVMFYTNIFGMMQNLYITFLAPNMDYHCVNSTEKCDVKEGNLTLACSQWEYNTSDTSETIVSEWDLVCDREWLVSLSKSIYMFGFLFSVFIFGQISDWIGRYPVIIITYIITIVSLFLTLLSTSYTMFIILRFLIAFGRTGLTTTGFVLLMEIIGEKHRTKVGIGVQLGWSVGFAILAAVAYFVRHWFWLHLVLSVPLLPVLFLTSWIPESPRWLLMKGEIKKFQNVLQNAAKVNGKELNISEIDLSKFTNKSQETSNSVFDLFKTSQLRRRSLCMIYLWIVNAFMYYGLSYNTNDLAGDPYINFTLSGVLEFPSYILLYCVVAHFGRRPTLVGLMLIAGIACVSMAFAPSSKPWIWVTLAMIGKFCITGSFGLVYFYTTEIFPTVVRNVAMGSCSMLGRIGAIIAPFVRELGLATYVWFPYLVYGLLAITSGLLALSLPETRGREIPDSIEDGENFALCKNEHKEINLQEQENVKQ